MESNATNFKFLVDISATETADYEEACVMSISHDKGETLDTWFDLCSKFANNEIVAFDPTFGVTFKFDKTSPVCQFILGKEYATGTSATAGVRIVNLLKGVSGKQVDFTAVFSNIAYEPTTEAVLEITVDVKVYRGTTFVETNYTPASV